MGFLDKIPGFGRHRHGGKDGVSGAADPQGRPLGELLPGAPGTVADPDGDVDIARSRHDPS